LIAPALGLEAFGLVAVEAMLRGVPVLSSDHAGLRESALGVASLLPVRPLEITGLPEDGKRRGFNVPSQEPGPWIDEIRRLRNKEVYEAKAKASRERALAFVDEVPRAALATLRTLFERIAPAHA
jgi:glycosyltransferase involved in cell wall biosynthesis